MANSSAREPLLIRFGPSLCAGLAFGDWLRLLAENRGAVDPPHWARAASITVCSLQNSLLRLVEQAVYSRRIAAATVRPPLFVLGVWRSGTTFLQNLLSVDERFAYPNYYQVLFPHTFLCSESWHGRLVEWLMPGRRPQDNMRQGVDEPAEDELALALLSLRSFLLSWMFPRHAEFYDRFLTFRDASPDDVERWRAALTHFLRKLSVRYDRPLILKSPGHTCRIRLLLECFPEAKFVNIHRNPYDVFQSARHAASRVVPYWSVQRLPLEELDDRVLQLTRQAYDAYFAEESLLPPERFCDLSYEALERDPLGEVRRLYEALELPDFRVVEPRLTSYVQSLSDYRKNRHRQLPDELRARVARQWRGAFERWDYPVED